VRPVAGARELDQGVFQPFRALELARRIGSGGLCFRGNGAWSNGTIGQRPLNESQTRDGGAPKPDVDPLAQGAGFVLQEEGGARLSFEREHAAGRAFGEAQRPGDARDLGSGNFVPTQHKRRIAETGAGEGRRAEEPGVARHGFGAIAPRCVRLFVLVGLRHVGIMPARRSAQKPAARLLAWYDIHRRVLPWRALPGERADPYRVWLSEIMLQQTTVVAVAAYYREFLRRWPTVQALARAPQDDVLAAWAGLGYYARARNLHRAAKMVVDELGGRFPQTAEGLRELPGVGPYTAGAIAAIAFDERQAAVDANAERVLARYFAVEEPMPKAKIRLRVLGQSLVPEKRAGDFAQALMDLGSAICTPKRPNCMLCPWTKDCEARKRGIQEMLPVKAAKAVRPMRRGAAFVARDASGAVLLEKRPENGLLGGMLQPPLGPWTEEFPSTKEALRQAPFKADWKKRAGIVRHGFTHFELEIEVYVATVKRRPNFDGQWLKDLSNAALPTVMRKIVDF
jgi:A/G-specific adenine glycosylase